MYKIIIYNEYLSYIIIINKTITLQYHCFISKKTEIKLVL